MTDLLPLVIDRSRWCRGGINGNSAMLNDNGCMCCLGFLGLACGYTPAELRGVGDPQDVVIASKGPSQDGPPKDLFPPGTFEPGSDRFVNSILVVDLIGINDERTSGISEADREERIREGMARLGRAVTFVDSIE